MSYYPLLKENVNPSPSSPLCHCGKPLHYEHLFLQEAVEQYVKYLGEYVYMTSHITHKRYKVQRHYLVLHNVKASSLDNLGFEEVK